MLLAWLDDDDDVCPIILSVATYYISSICYIYLPNTLHKEDVRYDQF